MKKSIILVLVLCMVFSLVGCEEKNNEVPTPLPTQKSTMQVLTIYTIDTNSMQVVPVNVKKETNQITPAVITNLVIDNFEDKDIEVETLEIQKNNIVVRFNSKKKPIKNCSKTMENLILDCFATSLLDNLDQYNGVIFRSEKGAYKSKNNSFKKNEVYLEQ